MLGLENTLYKNFRKHTTTQDQKSQVLMAGKKSKNGEIWAGLGAVVIL